MRLQPIYNAVYYHSLEEKTLIQQTWLFLNNMSIRNVFVKERHNGMVSFIKTKTKLHFIGKVIQKKVEPLLNCLKKDRLR